MRDITANKGRARGMYSCLSPHSEKWGGKYALNCLVGRNSETPVPKPAPDVSGAFGSSKVSLALAVKYAELQLRLPKSS